MVAIITPTPYTYFYFLKITVLFYLHECWWSMCMLVETRVSDPRGLELEGAVKCMDAENWFFGTAASALTTEPSPQPLFLHTQVSHHYNRQAEWDLKVTEGPDVVASPNFQRKASCCAHRLRKHTECLKMKTSPPTAEAACSPSTAAACCGSHACQCGYWGTDHTGTTAQTRHRTLWD